MIGTTQTEKHSDAPHGTLSPALIVCLDIETSDAPEEVIKAAIEAWEPPSNIKDPEKIEARRKEAEVSIREKAALLDGAPIACIAVRTEKVGQVFNGMDGKAYKVNHSTVVSSGDEEEMLKEFRAWLDLSTSTHTILTGFNIKGFDLRRIRSRFIHHRLKLPQALMPRMLEDERQPLVDVMDLYLRWFGPDSNRFYISLDEVTKALKLPRHKELVDGSQIPGLVREGKVKEVLTYCAIDTMSTLEAYLLMTSSAKGMN